MILIRLLWIELLRMFLMKILVNVLNRWDGIMKMFVMVIVYLILKKQLKELNQVLNLL